MTDAATSDATPLPTEIFALSDTAVEVMADDDPLLATGLGLPGRNGRWPDLGPSGVAARRARLAALLDAAEASPAPDQRSMIAKRVLAAEMANGIATIDSNLWQRDLNNIVSPWQDIRTVFDLMPTDTIEHWSDIVTRLETIRQPLDGYKASLSLGLELGTAAAMRQVRAAIDQGRIAQGAGSSLCELAKRFVASEIDDAMMAQRLDTAIAHARRAYGDMTDWLDTTYLPAARPDDAAGRDDWLASSSRFLGRIVDPEETYAWGWAELERLLVRRAEVAATIDPDATTDEVMARMNTDPDVAAADADEFIAFVQQRQNDALALLDGSHFDVPAPIRTVEVRVAPPGGATAAHYIGPSEDFTRPGRVMYPLDAKTTFPLYEEVTTAYHEGFPGHHLQVGWQVAMGDRLSRFHRLAVWYPGSGEGWALYAEHLMGELGFLERPEYELGLLSSQIFRAARIVIDIGCHLGLVIPADALRGLTPFSHPGATWEYDIGIDMLRTVAFLDEASAESEMIRYLGWPGQAISYKVGERFILDLRERSSGAPDFDLKRFHADLLSLGSLGLDLLEELMTQHSS